jgi:two-component system phosphate regulon sensor histidine kinase PhoR
MTIFRKSLVTLSFAALLFSSVLVGAVLLFMNALYYKTNAAAVENTAETLLAVSGAAVTAYLNELSATVPQDAGFSHIGGDSPYRLTLIAPDGTVLWDSRITGELVNHLDRTEVEAALAGRKGSARRNSLSTGMQQIYSALPVYGKDGRVSGVFRLSATVPGFWRRISPAALPFLLLSLMVYAAAFAAIFGFSRSLSAALARLVHIAREAAAGPWYSLPAPGFPSGSGGLETSTAQEFLTLEQALRGMAVELNLRVDTARAEGGRLTAILNGMSEAVFAMDGDLTLRLVNPRARELFNLGGARGLSLLEAVHSTELEEAAKTAFSEGRALEKEVKLRPGTGILNGGGNGEQSFRVCAAPFRAGGADDEGGESGVVLVLQDITRLVKLEQIRRDFVANVSHELRTPIQLIKGFSETLLDTPGGLPGGGAEQARHFVEIINKNAVTMENLVNDLLNLSHLENGGHPAMEEQEIAPLVQEAVSALGFQAEKKHIEVITECPADLAAQVYGPYIVQALVNLLDNAMKYSGEASRVWVCAYTEGGQTLTLEVRDEGPGIPAEHQERIFERFYRVDRGRGAGGTGLGLSIVRHIVLLHNGTVELHSRAGSGAAFRIYLPLSQL